MTDMNSIPVRPTIAVTVELGIVIVTAAGFPEPGTVRFILFSASAAASTGLAQIHGLEQR